ncbi:MAG: cytochrome C assembly protein [Bacteroidetes bacterium HGW-Bacteroidetes-6]|jgi:ABC-type transport system involved in cytochrome c biogenesis permease subunit|nr:MAG: cytochrome C assembly protein [Bacteroidetes bacterium HGW-Bacteroidetes-6]
MIYNSFIAYAFVSLGLLVVASGLVLVKKLRNIAVIVAAVAFAVIVYYISSLWFSLERPPLRTLGETRLWYALFLTFLSILFWLRWKYVWLFIYSNLMAALFLVIDIANPNALDQTLMPALQSIWFVPHVIVYIVGYALLGVSALVAAYTIILKWIFKRHVESLKDADNMVYLGFAFLTLGLVFGALWAKSAWGNYWTWDPKETWAFITWMSYLAYIHFRYYHPEKKTTAVWILALAFVFLIVCWFGVNYLPSAQNSVHTY